MRVEVLGHQCHASRPQEGRNSLVAAADMILHVRDLESIYAQVDPLFQPPCCTFVPTRHEENVPNINSLPGKDVFYIDCRILRASATTTCSPPPGRSWKPWRSVMA